MLLFLVLISFLSVFGKFHSIPPRKDYPHIIAHRGASGYVPEHSLQAYQLAIDLKTDYIEPDLCISKDGVFVVMHDVLLDETTNVASIPEYADRYTTKTVEGVNTTGYFVSDFTLDELKTLRLKQRLASAGRTQLFDNYFTIPTFDEVVSLAQSSYNKTGRMIGIYPELKKPSYHHSLGWEMEDMLLNALSKSGYLTTGNDVPNDLNYVVPVLVQCFSPKSLVYLRSKSTLPLLQLLEKTTVSFWTNSSVAEIADYATAIGPEKSVLGNSDYSTAMEIVNLIRFYKLFLHPWTLRQDSGIGEKFAGDFSKEQMYYYCCLGVDGMFTEFPDQTRESIDLMKNYTIWNTSSSNKCPINCDKP